MSEDPGQALLTAAVLSSALSPREREPGVDSWAQVISGLLCVLRDLVSCAKRETAKELSWVQAGGEAVGEDAWYGGPGVQRYRGVGIQGCRDVGG